MKNDFLCGVFCLLLLTCSSAMAQRQRTHARPSPSPIQQEDTWIYAQGTLSQQIRELSRQISSGLAENQKRTIAVVEFADLRGNVTTFGRLIAEELITRLYETRKFKVIERQLLNKIIAEQKLTLTGIIDQKSAKELGRLLGVDAIASGTITDLGESIRINARLIDTTTAEIFAVASIEVSMDATIAELMEDGLSEPEADESNRSGPRGKLIARKIEAQFFSFELHRCRLSGTTVACDLTIVNNDRDRRLSICTGGVIFDDAGNQYRMYRAQLANDEGGDASAFLISGVSTGARVTFEGVSPSANRITLLSLKICNVQGGADFHLQYRNLPLRGADVGPVKAVSDRVGRARFGRHETFRINGNQGWTDTNIDVLPGMRLEMIASGRVFITTENSTSTQVVNELLKRRPIRLPQRSVGTNALLVKIVYANGGESSVIRVGDQNTLIVGNGQYGRLMFGIDDKNVTDNSGYFTVSVRW